MKSRGLGWGCGVSEWSCAAENSSVGTVNVNFGLVNAGLRGESFRSGLECGEDGGFFCGCVVFEDLLEELGNDAFGSCGFADFGEWSEEA